ncbi:hypothetical protein ABBQ38_008102 [Trebouxia sp. C0009 RCD-2024]
MAGQCLEALMFAGIVPDASSAPACLEVGHPLSPLLCCKRAVHLPESCRALRPLSAAVKANLERCTRVDRDFRTDQQRSRDIQVQRATSRKEEAVSAAGSLKGQLKVVNREKANLQEQVEELQVKVQSLKPQAGDSQQAKEASSSTESDCASPEAPHADTWSMPTSGSGWDDGWDVVGPVRSPRRSTSFGARRGLLRRTESQN